MKKTVFSMLILLFIVGCTSEQKTGLERVKSTGVMLVGTDATYPPFEFNDDESGDLVGFDIDLMTAICKELKLKPEFIVVPFGGIIPGLRSNKYDCIISAMTITEDRRQAVNFTRPYYDAGQTIAVPLDNTVIQSIDDLKGKKIGTQLGTTGEIMAKTIEDADVISFPNIGAAFIDMENGNIDAVLNDAPTSSRAIKVRGTAKIVGPLLSEEQYGIAVDQSNIVLLEVINKALEKLISEGIVDSLKSHWVGG
ncbi:MAG: basic amino acid ABC transporter substrate-binding protein [candidate division Zixibacteria bacterium]|nr:basic amino acid ABC transporter substrate-binding protein [candidate division Zixibacteria bacterium]